LVGATLPLPPSVGGRRVVMASTVPAAVLVAAQVAQLRVSGITDAATVRGVLMAASEPIAGVAAWRQGAGALRRAPTAALARRRPLVGGNLDLFGEPTAGAPWSSAASVIGGKAAGPTSVVLPDRVTTSARAT